MGRKNKYTKDIKVKSIKEYLKGEKSIREICNELECSEGVVRRWVILYKELDRKFLKKKFIILIIQKNLKKKYVSTF